MKLNRTQFIYSIQNLMACYNQFLSPDSVQATANAWFEKLKDQEDHVVKMVINKWDGDKMPNAGQILKICLKIESNRSIDIPLSQDELTCKYGEYDDNDECDASKYLCSNHSDHFKIDADQVSRCLNSRLDKKIICRWHQQVILCKSSRKVNGTTAFEWDEWMINNVENEWYDKGYISWKEIRKINERKDN